MPDGAQAWKMIKTPGTHTDRIAQACDRCRSKKIRCDGLRPHCSQCLAVGFECKISDKLTRRAFPRGYTESLEDRIRQLEAENGRLSNLLDVKDEQMEMLSRVEAVHGESNVNEDGNSNVNNNNNNSNNSNNGNNSNNNNNNNNNSNPSSISSGPTPNRAPSIISNESIFSPESPDDEDEFIVNHVNNLGADGTYRGTSAGGAFINSFIQKLKAKNSNVVDPVQRIASYFSSTIQGGLTKSALKTFHRSSYSYNNDLLSPPGSTSDLLENSQLSSMFPSRLSCDKLVTVYFQEWQSVFTILDQSKFLADYQTFMEEEENNDEIYAATLALVLSLACLSNKEGTSLTISEIWKLDDIWKKILSQRRSPSLPLLQALALAQLYSLHVGNLDDVWNYRMLTTSISLRLGYHRSRKAIRNSNGEPLTVYEREITRRVFWVVYTLDVFSSAVLGSPRLFNDNQIQCYIPKYIDEEVVNESFITPPPNTPESTVDNNNIQPSCQVSIIIFSRILANILDTVYSPKKLSHHSKTILMLEDQLESWHRDLPSNLKFEFVNGMPTASLSPVHQKSPLLLMLYHYARVLIHFPTAADESNTTTYGSSSIVAIMQSAKTYLQISNYLKARNVTSTLPLSPTRMTFLFGSVILYCAIDYSKGGALLQQSRKLISQALGYIYNDMQSGLPGSITGECFQWLEEICDSVLNGSPSQNRKSSNSSASGKPKERSRSQEKKKSDKSQTTRERSQSLVIPPQQQINPISPPSNSPYQVKVESPSQVESPSYQQIIIPQQPILDSNTNLLTSMPVPIQINPKYQQQYRYQPPQQHQQSQQSQQQQYYTQNNINTVVNVLPTSPVDDFFDASSFEDFEINHVLDPSSISIKAEPQTNTNTSTNTFLDNFNWDDSYNWSTMAV